MILSSRACANVHLLFVYTYQNSTDGRMDRRTENVILKRSARMDRRMNAGFASRPISSVVVAASPRTAAVVVCMYAFPTLSL